jgi:anti-sigma factor RsiW
MTTTPDDLTCREVARWLDDYLDGTLGADERAAFEAHLAECPDCRTYLRSYADTIRLTKETGGDDSTPTSIPERLVRAILTARRR